jgi:hypothetical protein
MAMSNLNSDGTGTTTHTTVTAHLVREQLIDGITVKALCGEPITVNLGDTHDACESGDYIVCPLCEAAQLLADVQIPHLEQGELFS